MTASGTVPKLCQRTRQGRRGYGVLADGRQDTQPETGRSAPRTARSIGAVLCIVARVARVIVVTPAAFIVLGVGMAHRLVGYNTLRPTRGWIEPVTSDRHPQRVFSTNTPNRGHLLTRLHRAAGPAVITGLVALALIAGLYSNPPTAPHSQAFASDVAFTQIWAEQQAFSRNVAFDPVAVYRYSDYQSEDVNQTDDVRATWAPPSCGCRRVKVWWFGGSAAWGFFLSDGETPASALARAAWDEGIALDIENRAVPGYTLGQEVMRFASLTTTEELPDLVIFYDGANELDFQVELNNHGRGTSEEPVSFYNEPVKRAFSVMRRLLDLAPSSATGQEVSHRSGLQRVDSPELARHAIRRYERGLKLARRIASGTDMNLVFAWQPTQSTSPEMVYAPWEPASTWPDADRAFWERLATTAQAELPEEVIDLSQVFGDVTEPLMPDWAHTNARGARIVAEQLLERLRPQLVESATR